MRIHLHEAIIYTMHANGESGMKAHEITDSINGSKLFVREDERELTPYDVASVIKHNSHFFDVQFDLVYLRTEGTRHAIFLTKSLNKQ